MASRLQLRRGTKTEHESFTGQVGETTVDTTNDDLRVHDGSTVGGKSAAQGNKYDGIKQLDNAPLKDRASYSVSGFYAGTEVGGGQFIYDASRPKADHNGGAVITPEAISAWDGTQANLSLLLNWTGTGTGAFVRLTKINDPYSWGGNKISSVNRMIAAGIKRIIMPISMEADETLIPAQGVFLDTGNGWSTITNNIPNGAPFVKWDSDLDGILRWHRWGNFLINNGTATGSLFDLKGIQHCEFGHFWAINSKGGQVSFAYFNSFDKVQFQNLKAPLVFTGIAGSTDCNFNYFNRITLNNWVGKGVVIENSRGNTILNFDAETSLELTGPALHLQDSSYNKIEHFWSEALSTATTPTIVIDSVISQSYNKKNIIEHIPQIITPNVGIKVMGSVDTQIDQPRLVGCSVGIDDAGGNQDLVISEPQFDSCTANTNITSNSTIIKYKENQLEGKINFNYTINSIDGGFGGYEYKVGDALRWKVTCKSTFDVDITTGRGLAGQWVDNLDGDKSQLSLRSGLNFGVAVTGNSVKNNTLFRDSTDGKLKYKDATGTYILLT